MPEPLSASGVTTTRTNIGFKEEAPDGTCADTPDDDPGLAVGSALHALGHDEDRSSPSPAAGSPGNQTVSATPASSSRHPALMARLTGISI